MTALHQGGCRCGAVHYTCAAPALDTKICHCRDCQYASGTAFSSIAYFPRAAVSFSGEVKGYSVKGSAGLTVTRFFCPTCGSPIYSELAEMPDLVFIKTGSLDHPNAVQPSGHMWWKSRTDWPQLCDDLEKLPENPPL
jgi:hypothetical protein